MARRPVFNGPYEMMDFPEYTFREWPKQVTLPSGAVVVATSQRHELDLRADDNTVVAPHPAEAEAALLAKANDEAQTQIAELQAQLAKLQQGLPQGVIPPGDMVEPAAKADPLASLVGGSTAPTKGK